MLHRNQLLQAASGLVLAASISAQTITIPNGTGTAEGNSSGTFPWSSTSTTIPGLRVQHLYDGSNFINQGVTTPIYINRIRWRANASAATTTWVGGTYANATIKLRTSPPDYAAVSDQFANNEGSNVVVGYSGPVSFLPGSGIGAAHEHFHSQGFEVLSISLDRAGHREKLEEVVAANQMAWRHVFDSGHGRAEIAQRYDVSSIPFTVLVGKDGKVAGLNLRGDDRAAAVERELAK